MNRLTRRFFVPVVLTTLVIGSASAALGINNQGGIVDARTNTLGATPVLPAADLEAAEVVRRAQRAVEEAGSYRFRDYAPNAVDGDLIRAGEVEIGRGIKTQGADGSPLEYFDGETLYTQRPNGDWVVRVPRTDSEDLLVDILQTSDPEWILSESEPTDGRPFYVVKRTVMDSPGQKWTQTLWIDAATFLPRKFAFEISLDGFEPFGNETLYADFGASLDVIPPAAALAPTPTPEPLPETSGGSAELSMLDVYFEPKEIAIPANEDVVLVLRNDGMTVHNFSIDEQDISVDVDWGTTEHIVVNLPPGVYEFRCAVPGHTEAGQVGILVVEER